MNGVSDGFDMCECDIRMRIIFVMYMEIILIKLKI